MDDTKRAMIIDWMERIKHSELTIVDFFKHHKVPFSKAQYFNYKKQIEIVGPSGLQDRRNRGGNRKLSREAEGFLLGCVKSNPDATLGWLQNAIQESFNCHLSTPAICRAIKRVAENQVNLTKGRPKSATVREAVINSLGGFEIIVAIAYHLGWPQWIADLITNRINELKSTQEFKINAEQTDREGRNASGKFSKFYNQRRDVRANRFASISEKRKAKNWQSMDIIRDNPAVLLRKSLALLSLPVITMNGNVRSVNLALGDTLKHLCGFNYKQNTIVKYLSELKYLGISTYLLKELPEFWRKCWGLLLH
jgi:transposase